MNLPFKSDMDALAERVSVVDLTARARGTARRMRVVRTVIAAFVVLVVASGAALGTTVLPGYLNGTYAAGPAKDGRYVFTKAVGTATDDLVELSVVTWRPGEDPTTIRLSHKVFLKTDKVSPNGRMYSYVGDDKAIHIVDLDSGKELRPSKPPAAFAKVPMSKYHFPTKSPAWSPDSSRLWLDTGKGDSKHRFGFVDVTSGRFTPTYAPATWWNVQIVGDHDGRERLLGVRHAGRGTELVDVDAAGKTRPRVLAKKLEGLGEYLTRVYAATPDGSLLCVETNPHGKLTDSDSCSYVAKRDSRHDRYVLDQGGPYVFADHGNKCVEEFNSQSGDSELQVLNCGSGKVSGVLPLGDWYNMRDTSLVAYNPEL